MPMRKIAFGSPGEAIRPDTRKAALAEFISTFIFVFAGSGSGITINKLTGDGAATPAGLIASAIAHAFALLVAVSVCSSSGGYINPAVTLGAFFGGNITLIRSLVYCIAQLSGSIIACLVLKFATGGQTAPAFVLSDGVGVWNAFVLEIAMTFGLVYTVYATVIDPNKKRELETIAPIAIGFIFGANILVGGPFDGASMNPAVSFGPAVVSWTWTNHWVYWAGPIVGGGLAGIFYELAFIDQRIQSYEQVRR